MNGMYEINHDSKERKNDADISSKNEVTVEINDMNFIFLLLSSMTDKNIKTIALTVSVEHFFTSIFFVLFYLTLHKLYWREFYKQKVGYFISLYSAAAAYKNYIIHRFQSELFCFCLWQIIYMAKCKSVFFFSRIKL